MTRVGSSLLLTGTLKSVGLAGRSTFAETIGQGTEIEVQYSMAWETIERLDDGRLRPYRAIGQGRSQAYSEWFIAEGRWMVERLLESRFSVESILVAENQRARWEPILPAELTVLVLAKDEINELVGYNFHRGIMACGRRGPLRELPRAEQQSPQDAGGVPSFPVWVACARIVNPENLGSIVRSAAAFGACGVIVSPASADPFSRRVIRVSAGNVFRLPVVEPNDFESFIAHLQGHLGYPCLATSASARPGAIGLADYRFSSNTPRILLLGPEDYGLSDQELAAAEQVLHIPLSGGTDSLNVAVAAAICLYGLRQAWRGGEGPQRHPLAGSE